MATLEELERALVLADEAGNTDDAKMLALEITAMQAQAPARPVPSYRDVATNAAVKGVAGLPDAIINTPTNLLNLGKVGIGAAAYMAGRPDIGDRIEMTPSPSPVTRLARSGGLIDEAKEPQTPSQRMLDLAVQGGVGTAIAPASGIRQALGNITTGTTAGGAAGVTKELTGSDIAALGVGMLTPFATRMLAGKRTSNPVRDETIREAQKEGYVVQPSSVNPSILNKRLESVAGKAAVGQDAAVRNQAVTNKLANKALGLPTETPLTPTLLSDLREVIAAPYRAVAGLSGIAKSSLEKLKQARYDANAYYRHYDRSADPASLKQAQKSSNTASMLERVLEREARSAGQVDLIPALRKARTKIAKTYDVERALNVGDANVSARIIGKSLDKGQALTGELKTIGKFSEAFPSVTREGASIPSPGVSGTDAAASAILGTLGYGAAGGPMGLLAAGLPMLRGPARSLVLSRPYQKAFASPGAGRASLGGTATQSILAGRAIADELEPVLGR